jgi:hypothetical protein
MADEGSDDLRKNLRTSADVNRPIDWIQREVGLGFHEVEPDHVGPAPRAFVEVFAECVLLVRRSESAAPPIFRRASCCGEG